ncbi:hypothetical protein K505DRAFT_99 [Melanomma pulvis-pyrius CBS 109.77]|uniref:Uncharacterized protein n=1 Tax=Melanomma pulvis-pyrius CBS 109.77 TaxID=1314802 RepID=A0A6A6XX43_9PLEO|nr:hypothetical protein K505DRAFT_99 [Melanomma pulvis-pyrius CBS 109.77]
MKKWSEAETNTEGAFSPPSSGLHTAYIDEQSLNRKYICFAPVRRPPLLEPRRVYILSVFCVCPCVGVHVCSRTSDARDSQRASSSTSAQIPRPRHRASLSSASPSTPACDVTLHLPSCLVPCALPALPCPAPGATVHTWPPASCIRALLRRKEVCKRSPLASVRGTARIDGLIDRPQCAILGRGARGNKHQCARCGAIIRKARAREKDQMARHGRRRWRWRWRITSLRARTTG